MSVSPRDIPVSSASQLGFLVKAWLQAFRLKFLPQGVLPIALGSMVVWSQTGIFNPGTFVLALLGAAFVQIALTMLNDTLDFLYGTDASPSAVKNPYSGGSGILADGILSPRETMTMVVVLYLGAAAIGAYLTWLIGLGVFWIALIGLLLSVFYSAKPPRLAYKGFGELAILIGYGPTLTLGAALVQTGRLNLLAGLSGLLPGLLMLSMIVVNEIPDYEEDRQANKLNLIVRIGPANGRWLYLGCLAAVYLFIALTAAFKLVSPWALLGLASMPVALHSLRVVFRAYDRPRDIIPANRAMVVTYSTTMLLFCIGIWMGSL